MASDNSNWEKVDRAIQKKHQGSSQTLPLKTEDKHPLTNLESSDSVISKPEGIIAQYKASKIGRKLAFKQLEAWHEAQLEVVRTRLSEAVRVRKTEAYYQAEQFLRSLEAEHNEYLSGLEIRNDAVRFDATKKLLEQTSISLKEIQAGDYPERLREEAIQKIFERYQKSLAKLFHDPAE